MKKVKILALLLVVAILALSSCAQRPCPAYTKADFEFQKDKTEHKAKP
jgi:PBP1b-binding outer membrane lipoprotein LpoB